MSEDRLDLDGLDWMATKVQPEISSPVSRQLMKEVIPVLVAELREHRAAQEARSKKAMWETVRILELEEEAVGLRADLAEANGRLDEMGAR